ncbi:MAG: hypothetical protein AAF411_08435 [Myxococcota bacterium]
MSEDKKAFPDRVRDAIDALAEKLAELFAPEPELIPVRVRRPRGPRRR